MPRPPLLAAVLLVALLSACSPSSPEAAAPAAMSDVAAPDDAVHGGSTAKAPLAFGATSTDAHGLSVTVAAPVERAVPAGADPVQQWSHYVGVAVTLVNDGAAAYDPQSLFVSLTSGDDPGEQVFGDGVDGTPVAELAPGATVSFPLAFGVDDPTSLSLEIAPDFTEPTVLYRS